MKRTLSLHSIRFCQFSALKYWRCEAIIALTVWAASVGDTMSQPVVPRPAFQSHERGVCGIVFDPEGKTLITQGTLGEIKVWNLPSGRLLRTRGDPNFRGLLLTPDTRLGFNATADLLISAAGSNWRWPSLDRAPPIDSDARPATPFSSTVFWGVGSATHYVVNSRGMLWALRDKTVEFIPLPEAKGARCMSVSANGRWLVALSAGDNGVLAATGSTAQISKTKSVTTTIQTIRVDANGRKIELPSTIGIWDVTGKNVVKSGEKILGHAVCLAINPDHQSFGCVTEEIPGVQLRALPQGERIKTLRAAAKTGDISCLAYTADGKSLICGTKQGGIIIWSLPDGTVTGTHSLAASAITDVALSKDGTQLAVAEGGTGNVTLWQFPAVQPVSLMVDQFAKK